MASIHLAGLFVCLLAATVVAIPEKCHIPDEDWEELVDQFLAKVPNEYTFPGPNEATKHNEVLAGFTVGDMTLSGLSYLKRYGTVRVYCKNGKPHVDIAMGSQAPVKMSIPWKYCGGKTGLLGTQANHVKICIGFDVVEDGGKVALKPVRVSPKWIESMDIKVDGAGEVVNTVAYLMGKLMPAFVKDFWIENLPWRMHKMLEQITK
uniref:Metastriate one of each protein family n=1 Tax=Rhipicephalus appendiculatus TaxID=34631 RepID=A0A131Z0T9_RHIAP